MIQWYNGTRVQGTRYNGTMVQCTRYKVQSTGYRVQGTGVQGTGYRYKVQCTMYNVQCTMYNVQGTMVQSTRDEGQGRRNNEQWKTEQWGQRPQLPVAAVGSGRSWPAGINWPFAQWRTCQWASVGQRALIGPLRSGTVAGEPIGH